MRNTKKLRRYKPTVFKAKDSHYDRDAADFAVAFIENLCHTKGTWAGKPFLLLDWQEQIIRDLFGVLKPNGYRQFNTAYVEIPKKNGKSERAAAIALLLCCGDGEERAEVYGCAADRQQASIVFEVAADMVRMCPALSKRVKILASQKRIIYAPTNSFYQVLSAEAYSKHGFNIHGVVFDELHTQPKPSLLTDSCVHLLCSTRLPGLQVPDILQQDDRTNLMQNLENRFDHPPLLCLRFPAKFFLRPLTALFLLNAHLLHYA